MAASWWAMYGYCREDICKTAWLGEGMDLVQNLMQAKIFKHNPRQKKYKAKPEEWLELVNTDETICQGYKFHLVKVTDEFGKSRVP